MRVIHEYIKKTCNYVLNVLRRHKVYKKYQQVINQQIIIIIIVCCNTIAPNILQILPNLHKI